ncbi:MAG: malonate transporter subunit MadL [Succiniclasticum sp.]|nr:malonate transporter subunit MadL [Succiniclasticum sp.]
MAIYGVALLAACYIVGIFLGDMFGALVGVKANVGGVGFAMLFLILLTNKGIDAGWLDKKSQSGISFWSAMYIPIVVAMSSIQNVVAALRGGPLAIGSGLVGVAVAFAFIPIINKVFGKKSGQEVQ